MSLLCKYFLLLVRIHAVIAVVMVFRAFIGQLMQDKTLLFMTIYHSFFAFIAIY